MGVRGVLLIGGEEVVGSHAGVYAVNPATGAELETAFTGAGDAEVSRACTLAAAAFDTYRETSQSVRAAFLRSVGQGIMALGDELIDRAMAESGLPRPRLEGERGRTVGQLEMFADLVERGAFMGAVIDTAQPERKPLPRPDLRLRKIAIGPVAVFGASNFPLAFSVAGGDTASALAVGCPVVVKAHPAHPGTSELVGRAIQDAVKECGLPSGVFALLGGAGNAVGEAMVRHPAIKAVGFTGSRAGGLALMHIAAARPEPIPVYAEMSSVNPVFLMEHALADSAESLAKGFVDSLVLGVGQFCTNPGLAVGLEGDRFARFAKAAAEEITGRSAGTMLSPAIYAAYTRGVERLASCGQVETLARVEAGSGSKGAPALFAIAATDLLAKPELGEEIFGPSSLLVTCKSAEQMQQVAGQMEGQLTATLLAADADAEALRPLLRILERKVGRIVYNGYPTGVEVAWAMVHGGPFPATSDSRTTSVGGGAIERFLRPVSYQDLPLALLPEVLQDGNPLKVPRVVDRRAE